MTYYDYYGMHDVVEEYADINYDKVKIASMNERVESDEEHPILGTYALASCIGLIASDKNKTYLLHVGTDYHDLIQDTLNLLQGVLQVLIIPGYYTEMESIEGLTNDLKECDPNLQIRTLNLSEFRNEEFTSIEFLYDTRRKEFIKGDFDCLLGRGR